MTRKEFLNKVICPICQTKIIKSIELSTVTTRLQCECKLSLKQEMDTVSIFKLSLGNHMFIYISLYASGEDDFYIAYEERPFNPLFIQSEIPDYIFMPYKDLAVKIELLSTFS